MTTTPPDRKVVVGIMVALAALIFVLDARVPQGWTPAPLYVAVVGASMWLAALRPVWIAAIACTLLTVLAFFVAPPGWANADLFNRVCSILAIWVIALFCVLYKRTERRSLELAAIVKPFGDAIISKSLDGVITTWNMGAERLFGYTTEEVVGKPVSILVPTNRPDAMPQLLRRVGQGESVEHYETVRRRKDGELITVSLTLSPVRDASGRVVGASTIARNITERKRSEEQASRLAAIVESSEDAILSKTLEGIIVSWNTGACGIYGYMAEEVVGKPVSILVPPNHLDEMPQLLRRVSQGESVEHYETVRRRKDGELITVSLAVSPVRDASGRVVGASTIARDITERKQAEEALRLANAYNRSLLEASLDPLVTIGPDGKVTDVNAATEAATGRSRAELIGTDFCDYFTEPAKARAGYEQVFREGSVRDYALELRHRDGHVISVLYNASTYRDEAGKVIGVFAAARDITERKRAEAALKEVNERLEQRVAERTAALAESEQHLRASLAEKEVLLKEIHHRVKNNMQVISSLVDLQADRLEDGAMRSVLQDVTHRVRSMALVHEKLYQSADMARVEFAEYAQSLLNYLWRAHGSVASGVRLALDMEPVSLSVNAAVPSGLILNELVSNALKHAFRGRTGGEVAVSLRGGADGGVCLRVRDNGTGLPPDLDWRQADSLGLRLVQILAGQLRATVEVSGGEGTEFAVTFRGRKP